MEPRMLSSYDQAATAQLAERNASLAEARRQASEDALARVDAADQRRADNFETARRAVEQVMGANTRLSISRNDLTDSFVYRAIDEISGEVVKEWPPVQFARFLGDQGAPNALIEDALSGNVIDEQA